MNIREIHTFSIPAGIRTYFLDVKTSKEGTKYLVFSESKKNDKGEYQHDRILIFEEHFPAVFEGLTKLAPELGVRPSGNNHISEIRKTFPNAYIPWTFEEDELLEQLYCEEKKIIELAIIFQRKPGAISSRIKKLELKQKYGI